MALEKIGFIGFGKMGSAIAKGLAKQGRTIFAYDPIAKCVDSEYYQSFDEVVKNSDLIILATKPQYICESIEKALPLISSNQIILSIAAGVTLEQMLLSAQKKVPLIRSMPNLPASVGKGVFALCYDDIILNDTQKEEVTELFSSIGTALVLKEEEIDAFTGLVGCGPGFVFHLMEGFYQAAVTMGFSHAQARELTVQTFDGSSELAKQETLSFYDLKQAVCSPKGVTIMGVNHLEEKAVNSAITNAILIAAKKK